MLTYFALLTCPSRITFLSCAYYHCWYHDHTYEKWGNVYREWPAQCKNPDGTEREHSCCPCKQGQWAKDVDGSEITETRSWTEFSDPVWTVIECDSSWHKDPANNGVYTAIITPRCDPKVVDPQYNFCRDAGKVFLGGDEIIKMKQAGKSTPVDMYTYHGDKDVSTNNGVTYNPLDFCKQCPSGQVTPRDSHDLSCTSCGLGQYASYNDESGLGLVLQEECLMCPAGWYGDGEANPSCKPCEVGRYQESGAESSCQACPDGYYQDSGTKGAAECKSCRAGTFSGEEAETCTVCQEGSYQDRDESDDCILCPAKHFIENPGKTPWTDAMIGDPVLDSDRNLHNEETDCVFCDPKKGQRTNRPFFIVGPPSSGHERGSSDCTSCAAGKFLDETLRPPDCSECAICPIGWTMMFNDNGEQKSACRENQRGECIQCPMGYIKPVTGEWWTPCEFCPAGTQPNEPENPNEIEEGVEVRTDCFYCDYGPSEYVKGAIRHYKPKPWHDYGYNQWLKQREAPVKRNDGWSKSCQNEDGTCFTFESSDYTNMTSLKVSPLSCEKSCYSHPESNQLCKDFTCPDRSFPNAARSACTAINMVQIKNASPSDPQNPDSGIYKNTKRTHVVSKN